MNNSELLNERLSLLNDAARGLPTKRIPLHSNFWTWKILDSESKATILEANYDFAIMEKVMREFQERYNFDYYEDMGTRNKFGVSNALGKLGYEINDGTGTINAPDCMLLREVGEYDELIKDPVMFGWEKVLPRKFESFTYKQFRNAIKAFLDGSAYEKNISEIFVKEYGVPKKMAAFCNIPTEDLFSWGLRGFRGFAGDMRRCPEKIEEYNAAKEPAILAACDAGLKNKPGDTLYNVYSVFLAHSCMNSKQFERFYYKTLRKIQEKVVAYNGTHFIFCEASYLHIKDFFQDLPKGHYVVGVEQDDIREVRKICPNVALLGGMQTELLSAGTAEECVNYAKDLIDCMGNEGFIFSQDKMISFRNDCKRENLLAVLEYARTLTY